MNQTRILGKRRIMILFSRKTLFSIEKFNVKLVYKPNNNEENKLWIKLSYTQNKSGVINSFWLSFLSQLKIQVLSWNIYYHPFKNVLHFRGRMLSNNHLATKYFQHVVNRERLEILWLRILSNPVFIKISTNISFILHRSSCLVAL